MVPEEGGPAAGGEALRIRRGCAAACSANAGVLRRLVVKLPFTPTVSQSHHIKLTKVTFIGEFWISDLSHYPGGDVELKR